MTKAKKLLWLTLGAGAAVTISVAASILWATPEAELSLKMWLRDLLKMR